MFKLINLKLVYPWIIPPFRLVYFSSALFSRTKFYAYYVCFNCFFLLVVIFHVLGQCLAYFVSSFSWFLWIFIAKRGGEKFCDYPCSCSFLQVFSFPKRCQRGRLLSQSLIALSCFGNFILESSWQIPLIFFKVYYEHILDNILIWLLFLFLGI